MFTSSHQNDRKNISTRNRIGARRRKNTIIDFYDVCFHREYQTVDADDCFAIFFVIIIHELFQFVNLSAHKNGIPNVLNVLIIRYRFVQLVILATYIEIERRFTIQNQQLQIEYVFNTLLSVSL